MKPPVGATLSEAQTRETAERLISAYRLGEPVRKLMLFPRGTFKHPEYGRMQFNDEFFDEIVTNFNGGVLGQTKPFIDIDHDHGAAAGWIHALSVEPDGLYASQVEWTPLGRELIESGRYLFFSPWWGSYKDPATGKNYERVLRGGGLTNVPFLKVLPSVALYEPGTDSAARREGRARGKAFMLSELVCEEVHFRTALTPEDALVAAFRETAEHRLCRALDQRQTR